MDRFQKRKRGKASLEKVWSLFNWIKRILGAFIASYLAVYSTIFTVVAIIIVSISFKYYDEEFLKKVLAGAHGLILNMFVLGIIVYLLTKKGQKSAEIQIYRDQIDNLRGLGTKEVSRQLRMAICMLKKKGVTEIDLSNCHLELVSFEGFDLSKSDFSGSYFKSAVFSNCNFTRANFAGAEFECVDFKNCDLSEAEFSNGRLTYTNFSQCNVNRLSFHNTSFNLVDLSWTDLSNIDFSYAIIDEVHFHNSDLEGATFCWTHFKAIDDLQEEQLSKVESLHGARFGKEFEKRIDVSRLRQLYPKLFEMPEWLERRKPKYCDEEQFSNDINQSGS